LTDTTGTVPYCFYFMNRIILQYYPGQVMLWKKRAYLDMTLCLDIFLSTRPNRSNWNSARLFRPFAFTPCKAEALHFNLANQMLLLRIQVMKIPRVSIATTVHLKQDVVDKFQKLLTDMWYRTVPVPIIKRTPSYFYKFEDHRVTQIQKWMGNLAAGIAD
jgi:hypothetical protein